MSLLRDIQAAAADPTVRVSDLLRKCKILASRLQNAEFARWVDQELNGYPGDQELPGYRVMERLQSKGHFFGPFGMEIKNGEIATLAIPPALRKRLEKASFTEGIAAYEGVLQRETGEELPIPWSTNLLAQVADNLYNNYSCAQAWKVVPRGRLELMVDTIKNKILDFSLEIEKQNPDAGEAPVGSPPIPEKIMSNIVNQYFHGNVGNVASGSHDFEQNATIQQQWQQTNLNLDMVKLAEELPRLRQTLTIEAEEPEHFAAISEVRSAEKEVEKQDAPKALSHLARAGQWTLDTATKIGTTVAAEAIKRALGMGSH